MRTLRCGWPVAKCTMYACVCARTLRARMCRHYTLFVVYSTVSVEAVTNGCKMSSSRSQSCLLYLVWGCHVVVAIYNVAKSSHASMRPTC